jgi:hypothetical protein
MNFCSSRFIVTMAVNIFKRQEPDGVYVTSVVNWGNYVITNTKYLAFGKNSTTVT